MKFIITNNLFKKFIAIIMSFGLALTVLGNHIWFAEEAFAATNHLDIQWKGHTSRKEVALTFDDGPDPRFTPKIIKILKKYHVTACFFVTGENGIAYPELVQEELNTGMEIGNHTYSHPHLSKLNTDEIGTELTITDRALKALNNTETRLFRPPYEELTPSILTAARQSGKAIVLSNITVEHEAAKDPKAMAERVLNLLSPGAIILAHDGRLDRSMTVAALPIIIEGALKKGYSIIPLEKLIGHKN